MGDSLPELTVSLVLLIGLTVYALGGLMVTCFLTYLWGCWIIEWVRSARANSQNLVHDMGLRHLFLLLWRNSYFVGEFKVAWRKMFRARVCRPTYDNVESGLALLLIYTPICIPMWLAGCALTALCYMVVWMILRWRFHI